MSFVTKEQAARARAVGVLDYIISYERNNLKRVGSSYRLKDHDSLSINDKGFYWHSRGFGGITALDYLIKVRGYDFVSAVCQINSEQPLEKGAKLDNNQCYQPKTPNPTEIKFVNTLTSFSKTITSESIPKSEHQPFNLPRRNKDNYRVIAYLQNRGIDRDLIMDCLSRGLLYESATYHAAVFLGKDENGEIRFATIRGTVGDFKCDVQGSSKKFGFLLPPDNPASREVAVYESAVDCLSHQSLCKQGHLSNFGGWRLALSGACTSPLIHFLQHHPVINHCYISTDNDETGNKIAERIAREIPISTERSLPIYGKDWNNSLEATNAKHVQNGTIHKDMPCL